MDLKKQISEQKPSDSNQTGFYEKRKKQLLDQRDGLQSQIKKMNDAISKAELEIEEIAKEKSYCEHYLQKEQQKSVDWAAEEQGEKVILASKIDHEKKISKKMEQEQQHIIQNNREVSQLETKEKNKTSELASLEAELKDKADQKKNFENKVKQARESLQNLIEQQPWIEAEKHLFDRNDTKYNFKHIDHQKLQEEIHGLQEQKEDLKKRVNFSVDALFEQMTARHIELMQKRDVTLMNKQEIEKVIKELDFEKNKDVIKTVKEVDKNFNDIFSVLLPGTKTWLQSVYSPNDPEKLEGIQLKVAFNG